MVKRIDVAAGVIVKGQQVLIARRPLDKHKGGYWEFPGGKVEPGEPVHVALARELQEEVGILVIESEVWLEISHDYPEKSVNLHFWRVNQFEGEAAGLESQEVRWVAIADLPQYRFPEANLPVVDRLLAEFT